MGRRPIHKVEVDMETDNQNQTWSFEEVQMIMFMCTALSW